MAVVDPKTLGFPERVKFVPGASGLRAGEDPCDLRDQDWLRPFSAPPLQPSLLVVSNVYGFLAVAGKTGACNACERQDYLRVRSPPPHLQACTSSACTTPSQRSRRGK